MKSIEKQMKICFLSRSLEYGGAERQMVELARGLKYNGHAVSVLVFYPGGPLSAPLIEAGVTIVSLDKGGRWDVTSFFLRLLCTVRAHQPQILYAFLGIPCILSVFVKMLVPDLKIIWGVRASNIDLSRYDWLSRYAYHLECVLSTLADLIIANSHAGRDYALANGFPSEKVVVVPNGIDTNKFQPCRMAGEQLRTEWGIATGEKLIGLVARLDPIKDHPTFINAARLLSTSYERVRFVCVGDGPAEYRKLLEELSHATGIKERIVWAGERQDMDVVYNTFDVAVLSSCSEGFPNVIGEAMACGVPCVVTRVGDTAWIVGDAGVVVPPQNPDALARGMAEILGRLDAEQEALKEQIRSRICNQFGLAAMVNRSSDLFAGIL